MIEMNNFDRIDLFNHYNEMESPFIIMTVPIDVTEIVEYCKVHKHFYATMGFVLSKAINEIDAFKCRYKDGKFYYCPKISANFTERVDEMIGFFNCDSIDYDDFIKEYDDKKSKLGKYTEEFEDRLDVVWLSCFPWSGFSGLVSPYDRSITIPQLIWDKYLLKDDRYMCNLMIMVHHGFADGYDVGIFIEKINYYIRNFEK